MRFLIDENPDVRVGRALEAAGHDVEYVKAVLGERTPDDRVVLHAVDAYAIVVTSNHKHFLRLAQESLEPGRQKMRTWGLLDLKCEAPHQAARVRFLLPIIELEHLAAKGRYLDSLLLHMDVGERTYTVHL